MKTLEKDETDWYDIKFSQSLSLSDIHEPINFKFAFYSLSAFC